MFDEARLAIIDKDLAGAQQGDRDAQLRVLNSHVGWLLHFARYVNMKVAAFDAEQAEWEKTSDALEVEADSDKADPVVGEPDEIPVLTFPEMETGVEINTTPDVAEGAVIVENEGEPVGVVSGEDSVAEPGSPTALAEDAAIAEAAAEVEAKDVAGPGSDPLDELLVRGPVENLDAVEIEENNGEGE